MRSASFAATIPGAVNYWVTAQGQILMLAAYPKSKQDDLSEAQKRLLVKLIEKALDNG